MKLFTKLLCTTSACLIATATLASPVHVMLHFNHIAYSPNVLQPISFAYDLYEDQSCNPNSCTIVEQHYQADGLSSNIMTNTLNGLLGDITIDMTKNSTVKFGYYDIASSHSVFPPNCTLQITQSKTYNNVKITQNGCSFT